MDIIKVRDKETGQWVGIPALAGPKGEKGDKGEKGNAFTYADFTPDQLAALKGEKGDKGDAFTYNDFTPEQLASLKGERGEKGDKGDPGSYTAGTGIKITDGVISATAEVYTAGKGISITNGSISAQLGSGLKFDTENKIVLDESVFVEYTDDEIASFYNAITV